MNELMIDIAFLEKKLFCSRGGSEPKPLKYIQMMQSVGLEQRLINKIIVSFIL